MVENSLFVASNYYHELFSSFVSYYNSHTSLTQTQDSVNLHYVITVSVNILTNTTLTENVVNVWQN